ncbi:hypothetical protein B0H19DRAFT_1057330 [Mycena capillaripes]|nr:hypothetical protein B0H19DRAFT_1057330 [Mycena capillaripes]
MGHRRRVWCWDKQWNEPECKMLAEYNVNRKAAGRKRQRPSRMINGGKMIICIRVIPYGQIRVRAVYVRHGAEGPPRAPGTGTVCTVHVGGIREGTEKEEWGVDEGEEQEQERPTIHWHQSHGMAPQMISPEAPSGTSEKGDVTTLEV